MRISTVLALFLVQLIGLGIAFNCPSPATNLAALYADPMDCHSFYQCDKQGVAFHKHCQNNLVFNQAILVCDRSPCGPFVCPETDAGDNPFGLYADPNDCTHFYQCTNRNAISQPCPGGLEFNPQTRQCDFPLSSGCTAPNHVGRRRRSIGAANIGHGRARATAFL